MADETVDDAAESTAEAEAPESASPAEDAEGAGDEAVAEELIAPSEVYKVALALYLEGDAESALGMIDDAKDREDLDERLRGKLDVLRRRATKQATRRFARPTKPLLGESSEVVAETASGSLIRPKGEETADAEAETADAEAETADAEAETADAEAETADAEVETTDAEAETADAEVETADAEAETTDAEAETADAEAETTDAEAETTDAEAETTDAEAETADAEAETTDAEAETTDAEAETADAEAETADAEAETADAEAETAETETSDVGTGPPLGSESSEIRSPLSDTPETSAESGRVASESGRVATESGRIPVEGDSRRPRTQGPRSGQAPVRRPGGPRAAGAPPRGARPRGSQQTPGRARPAQANSLARDLEKLQDNVDKIATSMRGVESHTMKVAEAYQRVAKSGKRKEQAYDQLYVELRQYKDNFLLQAQKPLFKDLILLFDGVRRTARSIQEAEEPPTKEEIAKSLEHLQDEILEMLYRRDIEQIEEYPDVLDIDFQKPVQRIETDDPSEDRKIAQVIREGFRMNGLVLRPQEVVVKRCTKEKEA